MFTCKTYNFGDQAKIEKTQDSSSVASHSSNGSEWWTGEHLIANYH